MGVWQIRINKYSNDLTAYKKKRIKIDAAETETCFLFHAFVFLVKTSTTNQRLECVMLIGNLALSRDEERDTEVL